LAESNQEKSFGPLRLSRQLRRRLSCVESASASGKKFFHPKGGPILADQEPHAHLTGIGPLAMDRGLGDGFADFLRAGDAKAGCNCSGPPGILTTVGPNKIIGSHGGNQPLGRFPQNIISGRVAVSVIDTLEVIQVQIRMAVQTCSRRERASSRPNRSIIHAAIPETRQPVMSGPKAASPRGPLPDGLRD